MDVKPWRDTLDAMTQPGGWIGVRDDKADLAYKALAGYEQPNGWIAHSLPARTVHELGKDGKPDKNQSIPREASNAAQERDAILGLAVLHELHSWSARRQPGMLGVARELTELVVRTALSADMGLRAKAAQTQGTSPYTATDFAHGPNAKWFFEEYLREKLARTVVAGVSVVDMMPTSYDPSDEACIRAWGRVWTAGAMLPLLDWIGASCLTLDEIVNAIWVASTRFNPSEAIIPTGSRLAEKPEKHWNSVHVELRTRAAVAYAFAGSEVRRQLAFNEPCSVMFRLKGLHSRTVGSETFYDGYKGVHLYLAVLSDCLHVANRTAAMPEREVPPSGAAGGEVGMTRGIAAEHRAALAQTTTARQSIQAIRKAKAAAVRLFPGGQARLATAPNGTGSTASPTVPWESLSHRSLRLLPAHGETGARWQPVGTIELWRELGPDVAWIDLLVVARIDDRQVPLPVTMENDAVDANGFVRSLLVLDEGGGPAVNADALRRAIAAADAVVGVVVRKSLGAFVVLEVDMNAQQPGERGA